MSADKDRGIRRQKQKRAKDNKKRVKQPNPVPVQAAAPRAAEPPEAAQPGA